MNLTLDVSSFLKNGYLHLPEVLSNELLERLREEIDTLCVKEESNDRAIVNNDKGEAYVICINSIVPKSTLIAFEVLVSDWLTTIAKQICGDDYFLVQDFVVVKTLGDQSPVNWHQDVISKQSGRAIMVGLYLDSSDEENGALRIVPKSHLCTSTICELEKMPYKSLAMRPGDVLIHDLMLAHSSGILHTQNKRRVVYFEFMSADHALKENIYDDEFVTARSSLLPAARRAAQGDCSAIAEMNSIYDPNRKVKAASYCFQVNAFMNPIMAK